MATTKTVEQTPTRTYTTYFIDAAGEIIHLSAGKGTMSITVNPQAAGAVQISYSTALPSRVKNEMDGNEDPGAAWPAAWIDSSVGEITAAAQDVNDVPVTAVKFVCAGATDIEIVE